MPRSRDKKQKKIVKKSPLNRRMRILKHDITIGKYKIDKYKPEECTDNSDPITLEDFLEDQQIVYFKAGQKNHCFELQNFAGMLLNDRRNDKISKSPITREPISDGVRNMIIEAVYSGDLSDVELTQQFMDAIDNGDAGKLHEITPKLASMFAGKVMPRELLQKALFEVDNRYVTYYAIQNFVIDKTERGLVNVGSADNPEYVEVVYLDYLVYLLMKPRGSSGAYHQNSIIALFGEDYYNMKPTAGMLEYAIKLDNEEMLNYMIKRGAPVIRDIIIIACKYNPNYEFVEELMNIGIKNQTIEFTESAFKDVALNRLDMFGYRYCLMMMCLGLRPSEKIKKEIGDYINTHPEKFTDEQTKYNYNSFNNLINMKFGTYKVLKQKVSGLFGEDLKEFKKLVKKLWFR